MRGLVSTDLPTLDDRYQLLERLGGGATGTVYRARDLDLGVDRALKLLDAELATDPPTLARFSREAQVLARLNHPGLVRVVDVRKGARPYLVMELIDGRDLAALLEDEGPQEPEGALRMTLEVLDALGEVHRAGLVHRDIKPHNLLLGRGRRVLVADFGLAHVHGETGALTARGAALGTWEFSAPEQLEDARAADARADLFGVAMVLYSLLTGRALPQAWEHGPEAEAWESLPPALVPVLVKATRRRPEERHASAEEMYADLARLRGKLGDSPAPAPVDQPLGGSLTMADFFTRRSEQLSEEQRRPVTIVRVLVALAIAGLAAWAFPSG